LVHTLPGGQSAELWQGPVRAVTQAVCISVVCKQMQPRFMLQVTPAVQWSAPAAQVPAMGRHIPVTHACPVGQQVALGPLPHTWLFGQQALVMQVWLTAQQTVLPLQVRAGGQQAPLMQLCPVAQQTPLQTTFRPLRPCRAARGRTPAGRPALAAVPAACSTPPRAHTGSSPDTPH
jgi:hypothetical protein